MSSDATRTEDMGFNKNPMSPDTIPVSREVLSSPEVGNKLPTSETAIGMVNNDAVCDSKRTGNER